MKSFLNYSKNRFLYSLIKFGFLLFALYVGYSLFGCINVYALTPTINKQAYYYHANQTTPTNTFCITSADNPSCFTSEETGESPWLTGTDLSFQTQLNAGKFSGTAEIYLHVLTSGTSTFYNRDITSSNVNIGIGIGNVEFPENNANVSDIVVTNFKIENITNEGIDGGILSEYISKVTFEYTGYTTLSGSYYVKIGVGASAGSDGLFQQINGNAWEEARLTFTGNSNSTYKSVLTFNSGSLTDQKLDDLNESITQGNQEIIDNQDKNTDKEIESQKVCNFIDKSNIELQNKYLASNGNLMDSVIEGVTNFINVNGAKLKVINSANTWGNVCFYNTNKDFISCITNRDLVDGQEITLPSNAVYLRATIIVSSNRPTFSLCKNGNQSLNDQLGNLNDNITDSTPPNLDGLADSAGWLPAGPVDSILNLPISLLNNLNDNLGGTCQPANLTLPFINQNITLPCMSDVYKKIGISGWVNTVGTIAAAFIGYYYLLELYKWVDNVLTMRENQWNDVDQWGGI